MLAARYPEVLRNRPLLFSLKMCGGSAEREGMLVPEVYMPRLQSPAETR